MALDGVSQLANIIGGTSKRVDDLEQNISPNEDVPLDTLKFFHTLRINGTLTINNLRMSNIWQVGHPVYGVITDDDGYIDEGQTELGYPIGPWCILSHPVWSYLDDCLLSDENEDVYELTQLSVHNINKNFVFNLVLNPVDNITDESADVEAEWIEV